MAGEWIEDAKKLVRDSRGRKMSITERRQARIQAEAEEDMGRAAAIAGSSDDIRERFRRAIGSKANSETVTEDAGKKKSNVQRPVAEENPLDLTVEDRARSLNILPKETQERVKSSRDRLADHVIALERALAMGQIDIRKLDTSVECLTMIHVFGQDMMTDAECAGIFGIGASHFRRFLEDNPIAQIAYNRGFSARMRQMRRSYFKQASDSPTLMAQFARNFMGMNAPVSFDATLEDRVGDNDAVDDSIEAAAEEMRARMAEVLNRAVARDGVIDIEADEVR